MWVMDDTIEKYISEGWVDTQLRKRYLFRD